MLQTELEISLSEISQTQKDKHHTLSFVWSEMFFIVVNKIPGQASKGRREGLFIAQGLRKVEFIMVGANVVGATRLVTLCPQ